jgi:hypothetical protein
MKSFKEIRGTLLEAEYVKLPDPPPVVVLRRIGIRMYPTGERIALYRNSKLNLDVSVPYFPGKIGNIKVPVAVMKEEIELPLETINETIMKKLLKIVRSGQPDNVEFGLNITISQLNQHYQNEIVEWANQTIPRNRLGKSTHISYNQAGNILNQKYLDGLSIF